jgi:hypothetical protein
MDENIDKIPIKTILKKIIDSTDDPRVVNVAKSLAKHSPKIAIAIAAGALTVYGIPPGAVLTPLTAVAEKHMKTRSGTEGGTMLSDSLSFAECIPVMTKAIEKIAEHQKTRPQ